MAKVSSRYGCRDSILAKGTQNLMAPFGKKKYFLGDSLPWNLKSFVSSSYGVVAKDFFRTCNVLPFSCTHFAFWRGKGKVKDPRYMQNKKDSRISLVVAKTLIMWMKKESKFGQKLPTWSTDFGKGGIEYLDTDNSLPVLLSSWNYGDKYAKY